MKVTAVTGWQGVICDACRPQREICDERVTCCVSDCWFLVADICQTACTEPPSRYLALAALYPDAVVMKHQTQDPAAITTTRDRHTPSSCRPKAPMINVVPASASPLHLLSETVGKAYEPRLPPLLLSNTARWSERPCCPDGFDCCFQLR